MPNLDTKTTGKCFAKNCKNTTTHRKWFCVQHIDKMEYASKVSEYVKSLDEEISNKSENFPRKLIFEEMREYLKNNGAQTILKLKSAMFVSDPVFFDFLAEQAKIHNYIKIDVIGSNRGTLRKICYV